MTAKADNKDKEMAVIAEELILMKGGLADERRSNGVLPVIGEGSHAAKILFVGEAPGKNEAVKGRPFCGASGKFLDLMLESIDLERKKVYITNIVKDRPTDNRDPSQQEIEVYSKFLDKQLEIIQPKVIATLGRISMSYIMNKYGLSAELQAISKIHGKTFKAKASWGNITIVPLYHPAAALYNGSNRTTLLEDFKVLKAMI